MNFLNKMAFAGIIIIPIIIAMYLFKPKNKEIKISSLYLWNMAVIENNSDRSFQKIRKNLLLILQIITAIFLVLALSKPYLISKTDVENNLILLDCSMSMQSDFSDMTRFEKAKEYITKLVNNSSPNATFSIITMNSQPSLIINDIIDKKEVNKKLKDIKCSSSSVNESALNDLIISLNSQKNYNIYLFSDSDYNIENMNINKMIVGENTDNTAITDISHSIIDEKLSVFLKVKNFGENNFQGTVTLYIDNSIYENRDIEINSNEEINVLFNDIETETEEIMALLSPYDSLEIDNIRYDTVHKNENKKVFLLSEKNVFLESALSVIQGIDLYTGEKDKLYNLNGYNLYIFDGIIPDEMPNDGNIIIFNPPEKNSFINVTGETEINNIIINNNSLFDFISNMNFDILKSKKIEMPEWANEILSSNETPVIISGEKEGQKIIICGFDLHNTDLPLKKEFPIFMYNIINWTIPQSMLDKSNFYSGENINIKKMAEFENAEIILPDGTNLNFDDMNTDITFNNTDNIGIYTIKQLNENNSKIEKFAVNANTSLESDLLKKNIQNNDSKSILNEINIKKEFQNIIIFILIIVLALEWWVYSRAN